MATVLERKIREAYREGGGINVLRKGALRIGHILYHANEANWHRLALRAFSPIRLQPRIGITIDFENQAEIIGFIETSGYYYPREIEVGLENRHLYTGLRHRGRLIGYNKMGLGNVYIQDFKKVYTFPSEVAFTYDTFILPRYRSQGLGAYLLGAACKKMKETRYKSVWAHIPSWNIASERMHHRLGFLKHKRIFCFSILGFSFKTRDPLRMIQEAEDKDALE